MIGFRPRTVGALIKPYSISIWLIASVLFFSGLTRLMLVILHFGDLNGSIYLIPISVVVGAVFDLLIALCIALPPLMVLLILPVRWRLSLLFRWIASLSVFLYFFGNIYLGITEIVFFDEFSSRFNYVAVDYLIYPHEVFINIWDTYPVLTILIACFLSATALFWLVRKKLFHALKSYPAAIRHRFGIVLSQSAIIAMMLVLLGTNVAKISENRVLNEITLNGVYSIIYAGLTNELDYNLYYKTIDNVTAFGRLRSLIGDNSSTFLHDDSSETIDRYITSNRDLHRYNIVLVLEESFGSNFVGALNPDGPCLTPRFDSLIEHSMLFSNVYATGNRTVRGLEASLLSFPPIPGRSVVKRPGNENLFSLPSILKRLDYSTVFLYGGLSYFDNFGHFASSNGFDQVVDELSFDNPIFSTIWGVCDEDLFNHSLAVFDSLSRGDKPFFATIITVSNHSPYTYPKGRIPFDPEERTRANAVRYADYAIAKFIEDAQSHAFFDSTLFVFLADHGARVYGSEEIPLHSYEIPVLFYNPSLIPSGRKIDILGSQLDLSPTILDFLGINYNSMFFGRSLLSTPQEAARVLMSHNRDVSLLRNDTLVVLNIHADQQLWHQDASGGFGLIARPENPSITSDAVSYYMTAYNMFINHELHPLNQETVNR